MKQVTSLRVRLTAIILLPVLTVAIAAGLWQLKNARNTAADVFDKSLLSAALAVANDVALSGGDALSETTRDILADTSGGRVFYHVFAPDGVIVAGYATPPVGIPTSVDAATVPLYFTASYFGNEVSGARLQTRTQIDGFSGVFTTTVWQNASVRSAFVSELVSRSVLTISALIGTLILIIWFGVRLGLRPLLDLQDAIEKRSSDELSPIQRAVPMEVQGIVDRLNRLFEQVSASMTAQSDFISNAAHQLRNPIAGVLSLAEAVHRTSKSEDARRRSADLVSAAQETATLTDRLLLHERAKAISPKSRWLNIDLGTELTDWVDDLREGGKCHAKLTVKTSGDLSGILCDPTMIREVVRNLVDNCLKHGGEGLSSIHVACERDGHIVNLSVSDNGTGVAAATLPHVTERFKQLGPSSGSGLGLAIVKAVVESHQGHLSLANNNPGLHVQMTLPTSH